MPEDSEEAGTIRSQVTGSNHSIRAVSSGTPCCVVSFVRVVLHSHGATTLLWGLDWWRPVDRMSNTANQQQGGERALKPGEVQQQWQERWDVKMGKIQTKNWLGKSIFWRWELVEFFVLRTYFSERCWVMLLYSWHPGALQTACQTVTGYPNPQKKAQEVKHSTHTPIQ